MKTCPHSADDCDWPIGKHAEELATRILATAANEVVIVPEGYVGSSQALLTVARFLIAIDRRDAARNALALARLRVEEDRRLSEAHAVREVLRDVERAIDALDAQVR